MKMGFASKAWGLRKAVVFRSFYFYPLSIPSLEGRGHNVKGKRKRDKRECPLQVETAITECPLKTLKKMECPLFVEQTPSRGGERRESLADDSHHNPYQFSSIREKEKVVVT